MTKNLKIASLAIVAIVLVGGIGMLTYSRLRRPLDLNDRDNILSMIAKNNPGFSYSSPDQKMSSMGALDVGADPKMNLSAGESSMPIFMKQSKYNHSVSITQRGAMRSKCEIPSEDPIENEINYPKYQLTESYTYQDSEQNIYYSKWIAKDQDGKILDYGLSRNNENYEYRGGKYAVKTIYEENSNRKIPALYDDVAVEGESPTSILPAENSNEDELMPDDQIRNMFGEDVKIEETSENGRRYYKITSVYDDACMIAFEAKLAPGIVNMNRDSAESRPSDKIVVVSLVEPEKFQIVRTERYLNSIGDENLIDRVETTTEENDKDFSEVSRDFDFDLAVEVKEFTIPAYDYEAVEQKRVEETKKYFQSNSISMIVPVDSNMQITGMPYIGEVENMQNKIYDELSAEQANRDFFGDDARGELLFKWANTQYTNPDGYIPNIMTYSYYPSGESSANYLNMVVYAKDADLDQLQKNDNSVPEYSDGGSQTERTEKDINIKIDDSSVKAHLVRLKFTSESFDQPVDSSSDRMMPRDIYVSYNYLVYFEYHNNKFSINMTGEQELTDAQLLKMFTFENYDSDNDDDLNAILKILDDELQRQKQEPTVMSVPAAAER